MMRKAAVILAIVLATVVVVGHNIYASSDTQCTSNFTVGQNAYGQKTYKTSADIIGVDKNIAFDRVYKFFGKDGMKISGADRRAGVISAINPVILSEKTSPMNAVIEANNLGCRITITFVTDTGLKTNTSDVMSYFCQIIGAAN